MYWSTALVLRAQLPYLQKKEAFTASNLAVKVSLLPTYSGELRSRTDENMLHAVCKLLPHTLLI